MFAAKEEILRFFAHAPLSRAPRVISWTPPPASFVALNVDGNVCCQPLRAGFGGCRRRPDGAWLLGFIGYGGDSNILHMELLGIWHGLCLAWNIGFRKVVCYSDSTSVVDILQRAPPPQH